MNCERVRELLADRFDDLLDPAAARSVDEHLDTCRACVERGQVIRELCLILYRPDEVGPPPAGLRDRILAGAAPRRSGRWSALLRYAAAFLAGVGLTLALSPDRTPQPEESRTTVVEISATSDAPRPEPEKPRVPRRIR